MKATRTKKTLFLAINFLVIASLMDTATLIAAQSCKAESVIGSTCSVECDPGETAVCSSGIFKAHCTCEKKQAAPGNIDDITTENLRLGIRFAEFLDSYGTAEAAALGNLAWSTIQAVESTSEVAYDQSEENFAAAYGNISEPLSASIEVWRRENGIE